MDLTDERRRRVPGGTEVRERGLRDIEAKLFRDLPSGGGAGALARLDEPGRDLPEHRAHWVVTKREWRPEAAPQPHMHTASLEVMCHHDRGIECLTVHRVVREARGPCSVLDRDELRAAQREEAALGEARVAHGLELDLWKLGQRRARGRHGPAS